MSKKEANVTRIAVLVSGGGSNLQSIIDKVHESDIAAEICCVISNKKQVYALDRAQLARISAVVVDSSAYTERKLFEQALLEELKQHQTDVIVMAGFMRVLSAEFIAHYTGRILNIHPSLLPEFTGLHTHQRALAAGKKTHGCSVHFASAELDGGPLIMRAEVSVLSDDNAESLAQRVLHQEHKIYPLCVQWLCEGKIKVHDNEVFYRDQKLVEPLTWQDETNYE
jgi:phosphoribosylglycinamide formyltransferase-1